MSCNLRGADQNWRCLITVTRILCVKFSSGSKFLQRPAYSYRLPSMDMETNLKKVMQPNPARSRVWIAARLWVDVIHWVSVLTL